MQRQIGSTSNILKKEPLTILAVSALALFLRLYHLGNNSLWFDEIGVAIATRSSSFPLLIEKIRSHVMAMPLDYVIGWLFTQSCQAEFCLRLPAALFGTMTVGISYILFRQLVEYKIAIVGSIILALSPFHIQYSQELRFYSSLVFFYTLSTLLFIQALEQPTFWRWCAFSASITIGSYFHLYVFLAFINGFFLAFLSRRILYSKKETLIGISGSFFISTILILPGYLFFKAETSYGMFFFPEAVVNTLIGFGWLPVVLFPLQIGFLWYPLFIGFQFIGVIEFYFAKNKKILVWILASLIQVLMIFLVNVITNYALRGRQLLILMPLLCLIVANGVISFYDIGFKTLELNLSAKTNERNKISGRTMLIYLFSTIVVGISISVLSLFSYYNLEKSSRREISSILIQYWKPGDEIWFTPGWESNFYNYYLNLMGHSEMQNALVGIDKIQLAKNASMPICWVTDNNIESDELELIKEKGFRDIITDTISVPDSQILMCR